MIETSSLPENDQENTMSKSWVVTLGNEENQENIINVVNETSFSTPTKKDSMLETPSTVSARREWLNSFAKRNSNHCPARNYKISSEPLCAPQIETAVHQPPRSSTATKPIRPVVPMTGTINPMEPAPASVKRNFTPRKKKILHAGIEATDDGVASVAKLSQWLANDPTALKKKKMSVIRGHNVSYKSRKFDRGQENVVVRENHIQRGSVSDKKNWLKNAFQNMDESPVDELTSRLNTQYAKSEIGVYDPAVKMYAKSEIVTSRPSTMSVSAKKDWLKKAFKNAAEAADCDNGQQGEARSMIITDDAASRLSVSDKKSWLQSAFKKSEEIHSKAMRPTPSHIHSSAATDIVQSRGDCRDEIAARAKRRFLQRSTRTGSTVRSPVKRTPTTKRRVDSQQESNVDHNAVAKERLEESSTQPMENGGSIVEPIKQPTSEVVAEEDRAPVDFRVARDFLVQRTSKNCETTDPMNRAHF
ncbi:unnamed protein product [Cylindrotheca closterium]|uniref:Uncharacterized protein n=1 Tax=Cylindrotheca closterium TaxID=2856 RepID=A0AAD2G8E0_9STRA|nr:unnamed protein product [Cylindrotheca closterium]